MPTASSTIHKRRSTRVTLAVFLKVEGTDENGQPFVEETGTLELSGQGCRYFSKHPVAKDSWLNLEIRTEDPDAPMRSTRARVAWVRKSRNIKGLMQVGVELAEPGNIWGLANPPDDWQAPKDPKVADADAFEAEMKRLHALLETGSYYDLLQVTSDTSRTQVKRNYYELVRKFHPDLHMDQPERIPLLQELMETVTLAYKTLTDDEERAKYDAKLATHGTFSLRGQESDAQRTAEECLLKARECSRANNYGGAILLMRKAVLLEPKSAKYRALLARSLSSVQQFRREALEQLQKAEELDPWNIEVHLQLGELYEGMELPWRARAHYEKVLEVDSGNKKARKGLQSLDIKSDKNKQTFVGRLFRSTPPK